MIFKHVREKLLWNKYAFPVLVNECNKEIVLNENEAVEYLKQGYIVMIDQGENRKFYKWADNKLYWLVPLFKEISPWILQENIELEDGCLLCRSADVHKIFPFTIMKWGF
ncbi:hypothetical protein GC101_17290 [Paenibacillus sp. LMG 31459]|uniref:Uncharacterized protein n=1 Tax=Paenibacillus phytohabitans TaxID=2654978 RepID=A0ABX1YIE3_9BACL|nr:hypothetical protein [Paenibacillus phytohabitans]NOU80621.1 hypothetical protein [Paenibacillus phytohabitans]